MRRYITIGTTTNGTAEIIVGIDKTFAEHRDAFNKLDSGKKKKDTTSAFAEVHLIDLTKGVVKRKRYARIQIKGEADSGKRTVARTVGEPRERKAPATRTIGASRRKGRTNSTSNRRSTSTTPKAAPAPAADAPPTSDEGTFIEPGPDLT